MPDPTLHTAACVAIEKAVAAALHYDPASRLALTRLEGKVLAVELTQPSLTLYFVTAAQRVQVHSYCEDNITTRIKGSPLALAALAKSSQVNLADSGVEVFGSTGLLIEWQKLLKNLDIDWEQAVSDVMGDVLGHETAKVIRGASNWTQQRRQTLQRLLGEYLSEEVRAAPSAVELKYYSDDVDALRLATDRIAARIGQLKARQ